MIFTSLSLLSGLFLVSNAAPTPTGPTVHRVNVSNSAGDLVYSPPFVNAKVGEKIEFAFQSKNHTVTQSSFDDPCTPLPGGSDTGFVAVEAEVDVNIDNLHIQVVTVVEITPTWYHCRQAANTAASHCGKGMVFAINPGKDDKGNSKYEAYKAKALEVGKRLAASDGTMANGSPPSTTTKGSESTRTTTKGVAYNGTETNSTTTKGPAPNDTTFDCTFTNDTSSLVCTQADGTVFQCSPMNVTGATGDDKATTRNDTATYGNGAMSMPGGITFQCTAMNGTASTGNGTTTPPPKGTASTCTGTSTSSPEVTTSTGTGTSTPSPTATTSIGTGTSTPSPTATTSTGSGNSTAAPTTTQG